MQAVTSTCMGTHPLALFFMAITLGNPRTTSSLSSTVFFLCHPISCSLLFVHSHLRLTFTHSWPCLDSVGSRREDLSGSKTRWPLPVDIWLSLLHFPTPHPLHPFNTSQTRVVSHLCPCHGHVVWSGSTSKKNSLGYALGPIPDMASSSQHALV